LRRTYGSSAGRAGVELGCEVPAAPRAGQAGTSIIRVPGCDGLGWLLGGIVSGGGAAADSRDEWAYEVFERTVMVPSYRQSSAALLSPTGVVGLRTVADGRPVLLRWPG
jgi:Protein of unknown function (DUF3710)